MATPICGFCKSFSFEATEVLPSGSRFKFLAVHCAICGAVFSMTDFYNTASLLEDLADKLGVRIDLG